MLPSELYASPPGKNIAQFLCVGYADGALTREELYYTFSDSDTPLNHKKRTSPDNGRTWSDFIDIEQHVNVQRLDGGVAHLRRSPLFDPALGIAYRIVLLRQWPGLPLYAPEQEGVNGADCLFNDHVLIEENGSFGKMMRYEDGPGYNHDNPFNPAFCVTNRTFPGCGMAFAPDGAAWFPVVTYKPGSEYGFEKGGIRLMRRDPATGNWSASSPQYIDPNFSSRGLLEPDVALLKNGNLLVVCRGSNTETTPGRKWMNVSTDGGRTLSPVEELRYDDGSRFYSPSSIHRFFRATRNGKLYWIANIVSDPPHGNSPRYPLYLAEIDEDLCAVKKDSLILVDDRHKTDAPALQLSNWAQIENRETLNLELYLPRIGQNPEHFWQSGVYKYVFSPD